VIYDVDGWLDKNKDSLTAEAYTAIASTQLPANSTAESPSIIERFVQVRRPPDEGDSKSTKAATLGGSFRDNLHELVDNTLCSCKCAFVRCLKPNTQKVPVVYDGGLVLNQLQYTGMLDTLIIRKEGWPARPLHEDFYFMYKPLAPKATNFVELAMELGARPDQLCHQKGDKLPADLKSITIFVGKDRVLIKDATVRQLNKERMEKLQEWGNIIQSVWRGAAAAKDYKRTVDCFDKTQIETRKFLAMTMQARDADMKDRAEDFEAMSSFLSVVGSMQDAERQERKAMLGEEQYMEKYLDATAGERFGTDKDEYEATAHEAYEQYQKHFEKYNNALKEQEEVNLVADERLAEEEQSVGSQGSRYESQVAPVTRIKVSLKKNRNAGGYQVVKRRIN